MADPLAPLAPGEVSPFVTSVNTINRTLEAVKLVRQHERGQSGASPQVTPLSPIVTVYVRNDTGASLPERSILKISDPVISPVNKPLNAQQQPTFSGTAPGTESDAFVITLEPAGVSKYVHAVLLGAVVCDLVVNSEQDECAAPYPGNTSALYSASSGPARIIWKASTSGTVRALVLLHGSCPCDCVSGPPPGAPTGLSATPGDGTVELTWDEPTGAPLACTYDVYYSTSSTMFEPIRFGRDLAALGITVTGLTNGTTYYFATVAKSCDFNNFSGYSNITSAAPESTVTFNSGSGNWTSTVTGTITWRLHAAGGGGGTGDGGPGGSGAGGGGSGQYRTGALAVTLGNNYAYVIGDGGIADSPGGNSQFTTFTSIGGSGGSTGGPGAGGSGGSGGTNTDGNSGVAASGTNGGAGGAAPGGGGAGGAGGTGPGGTGGTGTAPGGGGGGGGGSGGGGSGVAGIGGNGRLTIVLPP